MAIERRSWLERHARRLAAPLAAAVLTFSVAGQALAITGDFRSDFDHPYVGVAILTNDLVAIKCSGTLIAPTIFLTAGHCTALSRLYGGGPTSATVYFEQDVNDPSTGYPFDGCGSGTKGKTCATSSHVYDDGFTPTAHGSDPHDVGLIVLDQALKISAYGTLPSAGTLDAAATARGTQSTDLRISGYGWSDVSHAGIANYRLRLEADALLTSLSSDLVSGWGLLMEGNGGNRGGTCSGDSGGPAFWPATSNQIVAIHEFGLGASGLCVSVDGEYRIDQQPVIDWILATAGSAAKSIGRG